MEGHEPNEIVWLTIVGISGDVRQYGLANAPGDQVYLAMLPVPRALDDLPRCAPPSSRERMERVVRAAVHAIGPEQPVDRFRTLAEVRSGALESPRLTAVLLLLFAGPRRGDHGDGHRGRHRVHGRTAPARVRDPHGPRCAATQRAGDGARPGDAAGGRRADARPGRSVRADPPVGRTSLRGGADGSPDLRRGRRCCSAGSRPWPASCRPGGRRRRTPWRR